METNNRNYFSTPILLLQLAHVYDGTDAVARLHRFEGSVDLAEGLSVGDELVDLESSLEVVTDQVAHLRAALDATESTALPDTASHKLECCWFAVSQTNASCQ